MIKSEKQFKELNNWFEIVKVRDNGVRDNECFLELLEKFKGPAKNFEIVKVQDNRY